MRFSYDVQHVAGKDLHTADTLSRAPLSTPSTYDDLELEKDVSCFIGEVLQALPISDTRLEEVRQHQAEDHTCRLITSYIDEGWPDKSNLSGTVGMYWQHQSHLTIEAGIILYDGRLLIPSSLRQTILDRIHSGHQGITKCRMRARQSVWWPGINREIEDLVKNCKMCIKTLNNPPEPLIPTPTPQFPWQKIATDLFEYKKKQYILIVDYYSRFTEVAELHRTTSSDVIIELKRIFSLFGILQCIISDSGPQYSSDEFKRFTGDWGISHVTSSPGHPSANGEAERAVRTMKELWRPSSDPYSAILAYHATPLASGYSPAELLMSWKIRSQVPTTNKALQPSPQNLHSDFRAKDECQKVHSMLRFQSKAIPLPVLPVGQEVWIKDRGEEGVIEKQLTPRSLLVTTPTGTFRQNRRVLNKLPSPSKSPKPPPPQTLQDRSPPKAINTPQKNTAPPPPTAKTTRSGRVINLPVRFKND